MNLYKRSNGIYYIKYPNKHGKEVRLSTKCKKKKGALLFVSKLKSKIEEKPIVNQVLFNEVKLEYLQFCKQRYSIKYYKMMKSTLETFSISFSNIDIKSINGATCEKIIMKNYKTAKYMSNLLYRNIRTFFNWAVENEYLIDSPIRKIKPPKVPTKNPEWLTENDLEIVLKKVKNKNLIPIYKLLFYTGLRANELLSLHWSNVDLVDKLINIKNENGFQSKTQQDKTLPLNEKALAVFTSIYQDKNGFIFTKNKMKLNVDYVSRQFKKAIKETNLNQNLHLHSLRHSFASNLISKGASIYHVSKLLSHSRISTTEKYSHVNIKELREASEYL